MSLELDLSIFAKESIDKIEAVVMKTYIGVSDDIIDDSPVDSGRFRSNWIPSINKQSSKTTETTKDANQVKNDIKNEALKFKLGDSLHLTNNLPYAKKLEYGLYMPKNSEKVVGGYSKQAKRGMVRRAIANANSHLKHEANKQLAKRGKLSWSA